MAFSPDGTLLATASANSTAQIWDLTERRATRLIRRREQPVVILEGHIGSVNGVAFSPDGTQVVTDSDDRTARIWDLATGTNFTTLRGHTGYVLGVAFSPDGTQVVTVSADRTARIWDLTAETATCRTLRGHTGAVRGVAFSPDGTLLVTASDDGTVRIWEVDTGTVRVTLAEFSKGGYASLSLDGYRVEGDLDNRLWWAIKLCRFAPGELDPYVPGLRRLAADAPLP